MSDNKQVELWEYFCDESYYHLWCVRREYEKGFGCGFHVQSEVEAKALCELLNTRVQPKPAETLVPLDYNEIIKTVDFYKFTTGALQMEVMEIIRNICDKFGTPPIAVGERLDKDKLRDIIAGELLYLCGTDVVDHPLGFSHKSINSLVDLIYDNFGQKQSPRSEPCKDHDWVPHLSEAWSVCAKCGLTKQSPASEPKLTKAQVENEDYYASAESQDWMNAPMGTPKSASEAKVTKEQIKRVICNTKLNSWIRNLPINKKMIGVVDQDIERLSDAILNLLSSTERESEELGLRPDGDEQ